MTVPTNRHEFKENCLRRLGWPSIDLNLSDDAIEDRIDEALGYFIDFYYDGSEKSYLQYAITQTDIDNQYITLPDNVIGAVGIFDLGSLYSTGDIFNITYQIALNDLMESHELQYDSLLHGDDASSGSPRGIDRSPANPL